ncbi:hypothetical protein J4Q44_G00131420 [Coregonus suidteri]|uniref:Uncharacterized protein n=1 Tax=Coregonus suidteri TaxID=861788 RepID=A0AAN8QYM0_9TELE
MGFKGALGHLGLEQFFSTELQAMFPESFKHLLAMLQDSLPSEIVFTVKTAPFHYQGTREEPIHSFSGHIQYLQVDLDQTHDSFLLDASKGITEVHDIRVSVDIIPIHIPLHVFNMTLEEGSSATLTKEVIQVWVKSVTELCIDDLSVEDSDSPPEDLDFIVTPPSNGHLALKSFPSRHILNFTQTHILRDSWCLCTVIFSTTARSLVLSLERNHALTVFPAGETGQKTDRQLYLRDLLLHTKHASISPMNMLLQSTTPSSLLTLVRW